MMKMLGERVPKILNLKILFKRIRYPLFVDVVISQTTMESTSALVIILIIMPASLEVTICL